MFLSPGEPISLLPRMLLEKIFLSSNYSAIKHPGDPILSRGAGQKLRIKRVLQLLTFGAIQEDIREEIFAELFGAQRDGEGGEG